MLSTLGQEKDKLATRLAHYIIGKDCTMHVKHVEFQSKMANSKHQGVFDISPAELLEKLSQVKVIDVRRPDEFVGELGHIAGAQLITLDTLPSHLSSLSPDDTLVFVCRSGGRSGQATAFASENGFPSIFNLQGGMILWNELGFAVEGGNQS